jgi:hypothetical protein
MVIFPTSWRAARAAAPEGSRSFSRWGSISISACATQPTFRLWSNTLMPGCPSGVVLAQKLDVLKVHAWQAANGAKNP